jgi:hypothetical protein
MNKYLIGVMVEATARGEIKPKCIQRDIIKETEKMVYIEKSDGAFGHKKSIRKITCGRLERDSYTTSFSFSIYDMADDENLHDVVRGLTDVVTDHVKEELRKRIALLGKWTDVANVGDLFTGDN